MKRKVTYGFDAPMAIRSCLLGVLVCVAIGVVSWYHVSFLWPRVRLLVISLSFFVGCSFLYAVAALMYGSVVLKVRERDWLFEELVIYGKERVLDVGCGQGLLTVAAAKRVDTGSVVGIDIWSAEDQTNNSPETTLENARREGVEDKIELVTGSAQQMPFEGDMFDVVISSWALHNIPSEEERVKALTEIDRVLKPGGQLAIMDIYYCEAYKKYFTEVGYQEIMQLGPRYTFGNATHLLVAKKPRGGLGEYKYVF